MLQNVFCNHRIVDVSGGKLDMNERRQHRLNSLPPMYRSLLEAA